MIVGARNHLASICFNYVKRQHPTDFEILKKLAEENYVQGIGPCFTIQSILEKFSALKRS